MHREEPPSDDLGLPPDGDFGTDRLGDPSELRRKLDELASADLVSQAFGSGEAAAFARRCIDRGLDTEGSLRLLATEAPRFSSRRELIAVADELFRHRDAGVSVNHLLTLELLGRLRFR
jgi:hypothetical protein